jgi:hypothetical protein
VVVAIVACIVDVRVPMEMIGGSSRSTDSQTQVAHCSLQVCIYPPRTARTCEHRDHVRNGTPARATATPDGEHSDLARDPGRRPVAVAGRSPLPLPNDRARIARNPHARPGRQLHACPDNEVGFPEADRCTIASTVTVHALSSCPRIIAHA